ncbi:MAG: T9SS type A sorting domain-containing protein [Crocinitomicaceae bacterium]|nr:T9SS type A sorting domain-containing protein [Crocinitomicaceae bacterium]
MKRFLPILFFSLIASTCLKAQTIVFEDTFDSYTVGGGVAAQSGWWDTWTGALSADAVVSNAIPASSGTKCAKIQGKTTDLVLPLGPFTSGRYDVQWMMYIPTGAGAYFNAMHLWSSSSSNYEWACQIYTQNTGVTTWTAGGAPGGPVSLPQGMWIKIGITVDLDQNEGKLFLNEQMVQQWLWSLNDGTGGAGYNQLAAIDFFGAAGETGDEDGLYYIDDVKVVESTGAGIDESIAQKFPSVFPNPSSGAVNLEFDGKWTGGSVTISDLMGREVFSEKLALEYKSRALNLDVLEQGIYLVRWEKGSDTYTSRLVIKK